MVDQVTDLIDAVLDTTPAVVTPEAAALLGSAQDAVGDARGYATQSANALTQLASWLANATSAPQAYATLAALQADRPQGSGIAVVIADGFLYWWDAAASQWKKGSQYQSAGLTAGQLGVLANALTRDRQISSASQVVAPYDNVNTLPLNSVVTYAIGDGVANLPNGSTGTVLTFTGTNATSGAIQIFVTPSGVMWHRSAWGQPAQWGSWKSPQANALTSDRQISSASQVVAPYDNVNTLPLNSVVTYAIGDGVANLPNGSTGTVLTFTGTNATSGAIQIFVTPSGVMWHRSAWGQPAQWGSWKSPQANALTRDRQISSASQVVAPYDNVNTLPLNSVVTYAIGDGVANLPNGSTGTVLTFTGTNATSGAIQIFVTPSGVMWHRSAWGQPAQWGSWKSPQYDRTADASLPSLSMFGSMGVIGDSYASGQISFDDVWGTPVDDVKWPVMLARKWGISYLDLAKGGLSTRTWLTDDKGLARLNASAPQDLYLFCLGINDYYGLGPTYLGKSDDIDSGADTFYGNSARILRAIQAKAPDARIIVLGLASAKDAAPQFDAALSTIAARFALPFIEQTSEPFFTSTYYTSNLSGGHPTGPLYGAMALAMERLIQRAVTNNYPYFQRYGYHL
jgi:phage terminase large subunit-like protein